MSDGAAMLRPSLWPRVDERARAIGFSTNGINIVWMASTNDGFPAEHCLHEASPDASAAMSLDPNHEGARVITGLIWIQTDIAKAIAHFEETLRFGAVPHVIANLAYAYARAGRLDDARRLERETSDSSSSYVSAANRAVISLGLGDEEQTLDHLEEAAAARSPWLTYLKSEPRFDTIRRRDRFQSVIEMIGL